MTGQDCVSALVMSTKQEKTCEERRVIVEAELLLCISDCRMDVYLLRLTALQ